MNPDAGRGVLLTVPLRLADGTELTPDMGGKATTQSLGRAIAEAL